jgi:hypothetical protein
MRRRLTRNHWLRLLASAAVVGTTGAANTQATSVPPGGGMRVIEIGAQVVENEKIETSASGSVQLLFIDKTTLSIGPNSSVVLDKFVFNPLTTQGEIAVSLSKGVLRLVGGQATHTGGATITTPVAVIGVRGGIVTATHSLKEGTRAYLGYGQLTMTSGCGAGAQAGCTPKTVTVLRPGFMAQSQSADAPPSEPIRASAAQIQLSNAQLTSAAGQTGGSSVAPTDQQAAGYNVGTANSPSAPAAVVNQTSGARGSASTAIVQQTQQVAQQGAQSTAAAVTATVVPAPTVAYSIVTLGPYSTSLGPSTAPYLAGNFVASGTFTISPILGYQAGGAAPNGLFSRQFQAGLGVNGQGASQTSTLFVMTSEISNAPNIGFTQAGGFNASNTGVPGPGYYYFAGGEVGSATPGSAPNTVPTNAFGQPTGAYSLTSSGINLDTGAVASELSQAGIASPGVNYINEYYNYTVTTATPTTVTPNHPNLTLQGYVGGVMQTGYFNPAASGTGTFGAPYIITNATGQPGDVSIYLPGTSSQMGAIFNVVSLYNASSAAVAVPLSSAQYNFGSYVPTDTGNTAGRNTARGAYVDPTDFAGRSQTIFDNGANIPTTSINGAALSATGDWSNTLMVTANSVGANTSAFLTSISSTTVTPCACEYTQWGFWSANTGRSLDGGVSVYGDYGPLMLWVAGVPTTAINIPSSGTATYTGEAVADIATNGAFYIAAGTFTNAVNFGTRTGAVTINGLDGVNYAGAVALTPSSTLFAGSLTGNRGSLTAAQFDAALRRNGRLDQHHRDPCRTQLSGKRNLRRRQTVRAMAQEEFPRLSEGVR